MYALVQFCDHPNAITIDANMATQYELKIDSNVGRNVKKFQPIKFRLEGLLSSGR